MASWSYAGPAPQHFHPGSFVNYSQMPFQVPASQYHSLPRSRQVHAPTPMHAKQAGPAFFDMHSNMLSAQHTPVHNFHHFGTLPSQWAAANAMQPVWPQPVPVMQVPMQIAPHMVHATAPASAYQAIPRPRRGSLDSNSKPNKIYAEPGWTAPWPTNIQTAGFPAAAPNVDTVMHSRSPTPDLTDTSSDVSGSTSSPTILSVEPEIPRPKPSQLSSSPATTPFTWSLSLSPFQPESADAHASQASPVTPTAAAPVRRVTFRSYVDVAQTYHADDYDRTSIEVEPLTLADYMQLQGLRQGSEVAQG